VFIGVYPWLTSSTAFFAFRARSASANFRVCLQRATFKMRPAFSTHFYDFYQIAWPQSRQL
jgi:hypothetical protein